MKDIDPRVFSIRDGVWCEAAYKKIKSVMANIYSNFTASGQQSQATDHFGRWLGFCSGVTWAVFAITVMEPSELGQMGRRLGEEDEFDTSTLEVQ